MLFSLSSKNKNIKGHSNENNKQQKSTNVWKNVQCKSMTNHVNPIVGILNSSNYNKTYTVGEKLQQINLKFYLIIVAEWNFIQSE